MTISNEALDCPEHAPVATAEKRVAEADQLDEMAFRHGLVEAFNRNLASQGRSPSAVMLERQRRYISMAVDGESAADT